MKEYSEERGAGKFRLMDDGDSQEVIFMYQSPDDVLRCDAHYITCGEDSGYYHHIDEGECPACGVNLPIRNKLFIPMFIPETGELVFWDRNTTFYHQLVKDVFDKAPNPSEYTFMVTRHGEYKSRDTRYEITLHGKNVTPFNDILDHVGAKMPDAYENICKSVTASEMRTLLSPSNGNVSAASIDNMPEYKLTARGVEPTSSELPEVGESVTIDNGDVKF